MMFSKFIFFIFDYIILIITLPISIFLILLFIVIIYLIDGRPIFFTQYRLGIKSKKFKIIKFRTIILSNNNRELLTKTGLFLRRSSLDELPQFINVLFRQMSIVGPRPLPESIKLDKLSKYEIQIRSSVLPGITGLSQVKFSGKKRNLIDKIKLDIEYIEDKSIIKYFKVIFQTFYIVYLRYKKNIHGKTL